MQPFLLLFPFLCVPNTLVLTSLWGWAADFMITILFYQGACIYFFDFSSRSQLGREETWHSRGLWMAAHVRLQSQWQCVQFAVSILQGRTTFVCWFERLKLKILINERPVHIFIQVNYACKCRSAVLRLSLTSLTHANFLTKCTSQNRQRDKTATSLIDILQKCSSHHLFWFSRQKQTIEGRIISLPICRAVRSSLLYNSARHLKEKKTMSCDYIIIRLNTVVLCIQSALSHPYRHSNICLD